ncbi:hypothetical protein TNCV_4704141 [Trichonephila clavipes]|nr:hypothetical protein TNCV_4704141 [Trichonephila clavipes]
MRSPLPLKLSPHTPTEGENKHRPALTAIKRDWLLKHHPTTHASTGLDSCVDITSHDRRHKAGWKYTRIYNPQRRPRVLMIKCPTDSSQVRLRPRHGQWLSHDNTVLPLF